MCRKVFLLILAVWVFQLATAQEPSSSSPEVEKRVDSILAKMGEFTILIGGSSDSTPLKGTFAFIQ
jgi:hypothetical protein